MNLKTKISTFVLTKIIVRHFSLLEFESWPVYCNPSFILDRADNNHWIIYYVIIGNIGAYVTSFFFCSIPINWASWQVHVRLISNIIIKYMHEQQTYIYGNLIDNQVTILIDRNIKKYHSVYVSLLDIFKHTNQLGI